MKSINIINDPNNKSGVKITKHDTPIFMVSLDLKDITHGQINVVTEYVSDDLYESMTVSQTIFNNLSDGKIELGYESGISMDKLKEYLNSDLPSVHDPSFLVRLACEYDEGVLASCIQQVQQIANQITQNGITDDQVMAGRDYSSSHAGLSHMTLIASGKVPMTAAKNAIVDLDNVEYISDIYAKTKRPLDGLIRRAYLVPKKYYEMHVFNDGVAKLQKMSEQKIHDKKIHDKHTYISWDKMQEIRSHQKALGHMSTDVRRKKN